MKSFFQQHIFLILGLFLLAVVGYYFGAILTYLLLAWVLSLLGRPVSVFLRRRVRFRRFRLGETGAAILTILFFYLIFLGAILLFVPTIAHQAGILANIDYAAIGKKLEEPFEALDINLHRYGLLPPGETLARHTQEILLRWFGPEQIGSLLGIFISTAGDLIIGIAAVTFILFFFLQDNALFTGILHAFVPNEYEGKVKQAVQDSSTALTNYFSGLIVQLSSFSLVVTVLLWLLGVRENTLLLGAIGGLFNIVPYVGPLVGNVFACFITIASHLDLPLYDLGILLAKVVGSFAIAQFIDNNLLGPYIFSRSVQAHPLEIFLVTLAAAQVGGVVGMILAIPVYTILRVLARTFLSEFKLVQRWTDHLSEEKEVD